MIKTLLLSLGVALACIAPRQACFGQPATLAKQVTLSYEATPLKTVLQELEEGHSLRFSYLSSLVPPSALVNYQTEDTPLGTALTELLAPLGLQYAPVGGQLVLQRSPLPVITDTAGRKPGISLGLLHYQADAVNYAMDPGINVQEIPNGPYAPDRLMAEPPTFYAAATNSAVLEQLAQEAHAMLPDRYGPSLAVPRLSLEEGPLLKIPIRPLNETPETPYEVKPFHFGIVYPLSTNGPDAGQYTNRVSIHLLGGYAAALDGIELSGFMNVERDYIKGIQYAGFMNVGQGNLTGLQMAGFGNMIGGTTQGAQLAGFINISQDTSRALQAAGFINVNGSAAGGINLAGFSNVSNGNNKAVQVAGFGNFTQGDALGFQGSAFLNTAHNTTGGQLAGFMNIAKDTKAVQGAGFANVAKDTKGIQGAGFINVAKEMTGGQVAGFMNVAKDSKAVQVAGFMNVAHDVIGLQAAGFMNVAKNVTGMQVGFMNVADTVKGVPIGFISFVKHGHNRFEMWTTETGFTTAAMKFGTRQFYNIFAAGAYFDGGNLRGAYGYGVGTEFGVGLDRLHVNIDAITYNVAEGNHQLFGNQNSLNLLSQGRVNAGWYFGKNNHMALTVGPTVNVMTSNITNRDGGTGSLLPREQRVFWERGYENSSITHRAWWGLNVGVRF